MFSYYFILSVFVILNVVKNLLALCIGREEILHYIQNDR